MQVHKSAAAAGFGLSAHEKLASTNAEALARLRGGERGRLWVTAKEQSAGRGRRANQWISPPGNLYATLLVNDPAPAEHAPELSFVTALATHDAVLDCAGGLAPRVALKWPNDLLCDGMKFAGILIEGESLEGRLAVAIGIGVNCRHHPPLALTAYPTTDLAAAGAAVSAESLFEALTASMARRLAQWHRGEGFDAIRADWIARAAGMGGDMRVRLPEGEFFGRGEGLDRHGRLLLRLADGSVRTFSAGEVFPLAAASSGARARAKGPAG